MKFFSLCLVIILVVAATTRFISADLASSSFYDRAELDMQRQPVPDNLPSNNNRLVATTWNPIRIALSKLDLSDAAKYCGAVGETRSNFNGGSIVCATEHILTTAKRDRLNALVDQAVVNISNAYSVHSLDTNLMVGATSQCSGGWTIPSTHVTTGIAAADFVLYVSAAPGATGLLGFAAGCQLTSDKRRTVVGKMNINPQYLDAANEKIVRKTIVHEFHHALGFVNARFYDAGLLATKTFRGISKQAIVSPLALMTARNYFGCQTLAGVELENEGGSGTANNHLDARVYKTDLMAGLDFHFMSAIDMAIMEDLGSYKANFSAAEPMTFGKSMGCDFLTQSCSTVAGGSGRYWCSSTVNTNLGCDPTFRGYGACDSAPPVTDGCGAYLDSSVVCADSTTAVNADTGDTFRGQPRCFMTDGAFKLSTSTVSPTAYSPRCFDIQCSATNSSLLFRVGNTAAGAPWSECTSDGQNVTVSGYQGKVMCPVNLQEYCRSMSLAASGDKNDVPDATNFTVYPIVGNSGSKKSEMIMMVYFCIIIIFVSSFSFLML